MNVQSPPHCKTPRPHPLNLDNSDIQPAKKKHKTEIDEPIESPSRQIAARIQYLLEKIIPYWEQETHQELYKNLYKLRQRTRLFLLPEDLGPQKESFKSLLETIPLLKPPERGENELKKLISEFHDHLRKEDLSLNVDQFIYIFEKAVINQKKDTLEHLIKMHSHPTAYQLGPRIFTNAIYWPIEYIKVIFNSFPKLILRNVKKEYHFALFTKGLLEQDDDFIKLLIQKKGSVYCTNERGEPLISTLNYFQVQKILTIMGEGARTKRYLHKIVNQQDTKGNTAIDRAIDLRNIPLMQILKKHGAEINPLNEKFETQMAALVNYNDSRQPTNDYISSKDNSEILLIMLHSAVEKCSKYCSEKASFLKKCTIDAFKARNDELSQIFRNYGVDIHDIISPLISNIENLEQTFGIVERVFKQIKMGEFSNLNVPQKDKKFLSDIIKHISKLLNEKPQSVEMFLEWSKKMNFNREDIKNELLKMAVIRSYPELTQEMLRLRFIHKEDFNTLKCNRKSLLESALDVALDEQSPKPMAMAQIIIENCNQEIVDECFKNALIKLDDDLPFEKVYDICSLYGKLPDLNQKITYQKALHPLVWATINPKALPVKSIRIISWLLNKNVDVYAALENAVLNLSETQWDQFIEIFTAFHINVELRNEERKIPLLLSAIKDPVEGKLTYLLDLSPDLNVQDINGLGALSYAATSNRNSLLPLINQLLESASNRKIQFPTQEFVSAILIIYSLASKSNKSKKNECWLDILKLLRRFHRKMLLKPLLKSDFVQNVQASKYPEFFVNGWENLAYDYIIPKNVKGYADQLSEEDLKSAERLDLSIEAMHLWRSIDFSKHKKFEPKVEFAYEDFQEDDNPREIQHEVNLNEFKKGYDQIFYKLTHHVYYQGIPKDDNERKVYYEHLIAKFKFILFQLKKAKESADHELHIESKEKKEKETKEPLQNTRAFSQSNILELLDMEDEETEEEIDSEELLKRMELKQTFYNDDDAFRLAQDLYHASYNCGGNLLELIQRRYALLTGVSFDPSENINANLMFLRQNLMQKVIKKRFTSNEREVHFSNAAAKSIGKDFGLPELPGNESLTDPFCQLTPSQVYEITKDLSREYYPTRIIDETEEFIMKPPTKFNGVFDKGIVADWMKQNLIKYWEWGDYHSIDKFIDFVISSGLMNYIEDSNVRSRSIEFKERKDAGERSNQQLKAIWDNLCKAGNTHGIVLNPFEESIINHLKKDIPKEQKFNELIEILKNAVEKTRHEDYGTQIYTETGGIQRIRIIEMLEKLEHLTQSPDFIWQS